MSDDSGHASRIAEQLAMYDDEETEEDTDENDEPEGSE